jgi:arylsulfatase A-like enzyme
MVTRAVAAIIVLAAGVVGLASGQQAQTPPHPNIVVFLTDDQGYGDLSSYGHPTIATPNLDRMAREGIRLTSFYAAPSCTPSRAQFLTGRYPVRSGELSPTGPGSPVGLPQQEVTIAEALKAQGYRTGMLGKWHLGDFASRPEFNPTAHGFDYFYGLPYSHDYRLPFVQNAPPVPLYRGLEEIERPVDEYTLTQRYTQEALRFIRESNGRPFFLYVAYNMPHLPVGVPAAFQGRSRAGRYGDTIEEIDWSVGQILDALEGQGLDRNTLAVFFSDNGPWANAMARSFQETQTLWDVGWAGLLRGTKGTTWEGGVRVPGIVRWPERIPAGQVSAEMASALDLFPTFVRLAGGTVPADRPMDGYDLLPLLSGQGPSPRRELFHYQGASLEAIRQGAWKLRLVPPPARGSGAAPAAEPQLFDLDRDPGERFDVAGDHPDVVTRLLARLEEFRRQTPVFSQARRQ